VRPQITVLISDSNKMHCDLLQRAFWSARNRFQVVAYASSTSDVINALRQHRPEVAVISSDLQDGPMSGLRIVPEIRRNHPQTKILVVMAFPTEAMVIDAFRFGAVGVFTRNGPFDLLCKSIEIVSRGQIWATSEELHQVLRAFEKSPKPRKLNSKAESRITRREAAVVRLAVEGLSNREIAQQLALTEHTVKNYLFRVFDKLGVSNRVELVLSCLDRGINGRGELAAETELIPGTVLFGNRKESSLTLR
jgi:two-component system, NarL family, nitrate/nitrite response regulator NarL